MIYAKCKTCRRLGQKLFLKGERCSSPKCAMVKRAYPPGIAGKRRKRTLSDYGKMLHEKQALKKWYGLSERQFKKNVKEILAKRGKIENIADELIRKLESRLDSVVFRLGFAKSRVHAKQLASHSYFLVNNKSIDVPSYDLKKGDIVSIKETKKKKPVFKDLSTSLKKKQVSSWLKIDKDKLQGELIGKPNIEEVVPPAEISLVFEFYSR